MEVTAEQEKAEGGGGHQKARTMKDEKANAGESIGEREGKCMHYFLGRGDR